ncbi:hypothetical protein SAMN05216223_11792 [Actinacidiphila yanglinensis]|uniref:Uncharacterized protein n=1 Tax=Actinacidiphila yanglinensis TaxID=310779 RepID=A0A1H6DMG7_9ACTN|nr:DUF5994 family protein [Actinacidiphila yanglinensis]SEG86428.1 hypothetical protein SAMN05216223_11792 [Actinacidiphila yanglinensis]
MSRASGGVGVPPTGRTRSAAAEEAPVRLALSPPGSGPRLIDGVWWPRSHDLGTSLPGLLAALEERWPGVTRVTVDRSAWGPWPDSLLMPDGRTVRVTRSPAARDRGTIRLLSYGVGRCDLRVVPPEADPADARRPMAANRAGSRPPAAPSRRRTEE